MATIQEISTLAVVTRIRSEDILVVPGKPCIFSKSYGNESQLKISFRAGTVKSNCCLSVKLFPAREIITEDTKISTDLVYFPVINVSGQKEPFLKRVHVELIYCHDDVAEMDDDLLPVGVEKPFVPDLGILFQSHKPDQGKRTWQSRADDTNATMERLERNRVKITFSVVHFCSSFPAGKKRKLASLPTVKEADTFREPSSTNFKAIILAVQDKTDLNTIMAPKTLKKEVKKEFGFEGKICQSYVAPQKPIFFCVHLKPNQQRLPLEVCSIKFMEDEITSTHNKDCGRDNLRKELMWFLSSKCKRQKHDHEKMFLDNIYIESTTERQVMSETRETADLLEHNGAENNNLPEEATIPDIGKLIISDPNFSDVNKGSIDVLLLTYNDREFSAAGEILQCAKKAKTGTCLGSVNFGTVGKNHVALLKWLESETEIATLTKTHWSVCMENLRPKTIVSLKTCYGREDVHQLGDIVVMSHLSLGRCFNSLDDQIMEQEPITYCYAELMSMFKREKQAWESMEDRELNPKVHFYEGHVEEDRGNCYPFTSDLQDKWLICEYDVPWIFCLCIAYLKNENYLDASKVCASYVKHVLQKFYFPEVCLGDRSGRSKRVRDLGKDVLEPVCRKLNIKSVRKNDFRKLAKLMEYTEDEIKSVEFEDNPTGTILQDWATSNLSTVEKLISLLKEIKRDDVVEIILQSMQTVNMNGSGLSSCNEHKTQALEKTGASSVTMVKQISYQLRQKISIQLNIKRLFGGDFRTFANRVGMDNEQIELLCQVPDPTAEVLRWWETRNSATIKRFREILQEMKRDDVLKILNGN